MNKKLIYFFLFTCIGLTGVILADIKKYGIDINVIISNFTAILGLIIITYQLKKEKDINEANFIVNLNNLFVDNEGIKKIYNKLRESHNSKDIVIFEPDDRKFIVDYLTYFETIYTLFKKKIFTIAEVDEMFAYRFFIMINDKNIQEIELIPNGEFYSDLYFLYKNWEDYRIKKGKMILKNEHSFRIFYENNFNSI